MEKKPKQIKTEFKSDFKEYPYQYTGNLVDHLNEVWGSRGHCVISMMHNIGRSAKFYALAAKGKHSHKGYHDFASNIRTKDNYHWASGLAYKSCVDGNIIVLFPWCNTPKKPLGMNRSINIYTGSPMDKKEIEPLLENLAYQIALALERKDTDLFDRIREQIALKRDGEISFNTGIEKPIKRCWDRIYAGLP